MYAIYAYIDPSNHPNVGIYGIHGVFGKDSTTGTERTMTSHDESTEEESQRTETRNNEGITNALSCNTCGQKNIGPRV